MFVFMCEFEQKLCTYHIHFRYWKCITYALKLCNNLFLWIAASTYETRYVVCINIVVTHFHAYYWCTYTIVTNIQPFAWTLQLSRVVGKNRLIFKYSKVRSQHSYDTYLLFDLATVVIGIIRIYSKEFFSIAVFTKSVVSLFGQSKTTLNITCKWAFIIKHGLGHFRLPKKDK